MPLTNAAIAKLKWRRTPQYLADRAGLRMVVYPRGRRRWQLQMQVKGKPRGFTVGDWPEFSVKQARTRARAMRDAVRRGEDPRAGAASVTVASFSRRWLKEIVEKRRKDAKPVARLLEREVLPLLGAVPIGKVALSEVRRLIFHKRDLGRPAAAIKLRDALDRMFRYAVSCGVAGHNPVAQLDRRIVAQLKPRTRVLTEAELKLFFERLPDMGPRLAAALELLLLTLARKGELLGARWRDVDSAWRTWEVPAERSKSGRPHVVYLSDRADRIFQSLLGPQPIQYGPNSERFIFHSQGSTAQPMPAAALNQAMKRVKWGMPRFTPHDLRRTGSTILNEKGYSADVIEKALNHSVRGIRGVYNKAQYAEQRKKMLAEWAEYLEGLKA